MNSFVDFNYRRVTSIELSDAVGRKYGRARVDRCRVIIEIQSDGVCILDGTRLLDLHAARTIIAKSCGDVSGSVQPAANAN